MYYFYVECRFRGYPKEYLKGLIGEVARKFRVRGALKHRPVPHMTLYGPAETSSSHSVFSGIEKVARRYKLVQFEICDFQGKDGATIVCRIDASPELKKLRRELAEELNKTVNIDDRQPWDNDSDYWFHATVAMKDITQKFRKILDYVNIKEKPHINQYLVRITVLNKKRRIEREYDLILKRWLNRREALSKRWWRRTINGLREVQGLPEVRQKRGLLFWLSKFFGR